MRISIQFANERSEIRRFRCVFSSVREKTFLVCFLCSNSKLFVRFFSRTLKSSGGVLDVDAGIFLNNLKTSLLRFLKFAPACQSAGCLLWLFVLLEQTFKFQPTDLWMLSEELLTFLRRLGQELVKKTDQLHQILFNK